MAVDLTLAKAHLRVLHDDENTLITAYLNAAINWVDGYTGKLLTRREVTQTERGFLSYFTLFSGPDPATVSVAYTDTDEAAATVDDALISGDRLYPPLGDAWPAAARNTAVKLTYTAGYTTTPSALEQAVLLLVGEYFQNRDIDARPAISAAIESLCRPYRGAWV